MTIYLFLVPVGLALIDFFILGFLTIRFNIRILTLYSYLKSSGRSKSWEWVTTVWGFGPGGSNPIRIWKYLNNDADCDDQNIGALKRPLAADFKKFLILFIAFFSIIAVTFVAMLVYSSVHRADA